jgi:hypothetical protein
VPDDDGEMIFDFNTVIPMPSIIKHSESSSTVDDGLAVMGSKIAGRKLEEYLIYPWVKEAGVTTIEGVRRLLVERSPNCLAKAMVAMEAYRQTGSLSWYDWANANWGTKWNCGEFGISCDRAGLLNFVFDTAWSPPMPVLEKLLEMRPTLRIKATGRDESERHWETVIA